MMFSKTVTAALDPIPPAIIAASENVEFYVSEEPGNRAERHRKQKLEGQMMQDPESWLWSTFVLAAAIKLGLVEITDSSELEPESFDGILRAHGSSAAAMLAEAERRLTSVKH